MDKTTIDQLEKEVLSKELGILNANEQPKQSFIQTPPSGINGVFEPILAKNIKTLPMIEINWVWEGFLAKDNLSLLAAREKMGKTSFLEGLLKSLAQGGDYLGWKVVPSRVVVVSEEPRGIWNRRLDNLGLSDCDSLWIEPRPFKTRLKQKAWEEWLLERVAPWCERQRAEVLILDTISPIWPVLNENDASEVQTALLPLTGLAERNMAVLAVHHYNKTGGIRGSTVLGAVPSILLDFGKPPGDEDTTRRLLKIRSRFEESPDQLLLDYKSREYILLGSPQNVARREKLEQVKKVLEKFPSGVIVQEILDGWDEGKKPSRSMLKIYLNDLCSTQSIYQVGEREIKGGKAFVYSLYLNSSKDYQGPVKETPFKANNTNNLDIGTHTTDNIPHGKTIEQLSPKEIMEVFQ